MKKLTLFILTIMLSLTVSTVSVNAAEMDPGTEVTNEFQTTLLNAFTGSANSTSTYDDTTSVLTVTSTGSYASYAYFTSSYDVFEENKVYYLSMSVDKVSNPDNGDVFQQIVFSNGGVVEDTFDSVEIGSTSYLYFTAPASFDKFEIRFIKASTTDVTRTYKYSEFMLINLSDFYGSSSVPTVDEFRSSLKTEYFTGTKVADEVIDFDNQTRIDHYLYDAPNIFEDFPNNITMESIIRIAFYVPLVFIYFLLIPMFNFLLSGTASGYIMLGLIIIAFILREVIRFIDPDFHLFGKNSYQNGYKKPKETK